ncbi:MAG: hypothetical protein A2X28_11355 [Elusimicrobia bacterium GWA2_56_46]|nr:MAG: hypothetical protein A2X28_11355 [Elusimicrobia bacterium GWA2_56_46]OGR54534.1 MAG: hypothetical protein A2X39_10140 [Elusimicrobia bacterium GWC2_56_31]
MNRKSFLLLSLAVACAAFLRFWALSERGFLLWDEAYYALEGKTIPSAISYIIGGGNVSGLKEYLIAKGCILPTGTGKPVFMLLLSAWGIVFGTGDFAGMAMTAFFGVLCVALVFFAAYKYSGAPAGLLAAFLLAFSGLHVWYSRSLMSNSIAVFFLLCGLLLYLSWAVSPGARRLRGLAAGAVIGLAFMTHYSMLPNLAALAVCEAVRLWSARDRFRAEAVNALIPAAGFAVVLAACELCYAAVFRVAGERLGDVAHLTYFQYLLRQFLWNAPETSFGGWKFYLHGFAGVSGWFSVWLYLAALAGSVYLFIKRPALGVGVFILQAWGTLLFWTLNPGTAALRAFVAFAPFSAITAGFVVSELAGMIGRPLARGALYALPVLAVVFSGGGALAEMLQARSVYPAAAAWLAPKGPDEVVSMLAWPFMQFYMEGKIYANHDRIETRADLERAVRGGAGYLMTDNAEKVVFEMSKTGVYPDLVGIINSGRPEAEWKFGRGGRFLAYDSMLYPLTITEVKIYPLGRRAGTERKSAPAR